MLKTIGIKRNLWATYQSGLLVHKRMNFSIDRLELFLPFWHPELTGSTIVSKDLNAITCTVTGAVWGATGRTFDGLDDKIISATDPLGTNACTIVATIHLTDWGGGGAGRILDNGKLYIWLDNSGRIGVTSDAGTNAFSPNSSISLNTTYRAVITRPADGDNAQIYIDGVASGVAQDSGTPASGTSSLHIGNNAAELRGFEGIISECLLYTRILTLQEIQHDYLANKWRYV